jgi:hypothetical protein
MTKKVKYIEIMLDLAYKLDSVAKAELFCWQETMKRMAGLLQSSGQGVSSSSLSSSPSTISGEFSLAGPSASWILIGCLCRPLRFLPLCEFSLAGVLHGGS